MSDRLKIEYGLNGKVCSKKDHVKKLNCADNPNCLYGLGEYKHGIWATKDNILIKQLGECPVRSLRPVFDLPSDEVEKYDEQNFGFWLNRANLKDFQVKHEDNVLLYPCGLKNLGATCYISTMLQCLYLNIKFRAMVYRWEETKECPKEVSKFMGTIQELFAQLQCGNRYSANLKHFTSALTLNADLQQDAQEFNKLLLSYLQNAFSFDRHQENLDESMKYDGIDSLFSGSLQYQVVCKVCNTQSNTESKFYELQLSCKSATISSAMDVALGLEILEKDNRYYCPSCKKKQDATRQMQLVKLPKVLSLQLMRFEYDMKTYKKKKIKNAVAIEHNLKVRNTEGQLKEYKLVAVLNHTGVGTDSGHYTADILHPAAYLEDKPYSQWFSFDDEIVCKSEHMMSDVESKTTSSAKAYMLIYQDVSVVGDIDLPVPAMLKDRVLQENQLLLESLVLYEKVHEDLDNKMKSRQEEYEAIFENPSLIDHTGKKGFTWVPTKWLQSWVLGYYQISEATSDENGKDKESEMYSFFDSKINTDSMICPHGKFFPSMARTCKAIPSSLMEKLQRYIVSEKIVLTQANYLCLPCIDNDRQIKVAAENIRKRNASLYAEIKQGVKARSKVKSSLYGRHRVISRDYIKALKKCFRAQERSSHVQAYNSMLIELSERPSINSAILCRHGDLTTDESLYALVTKKLWKGIVDFQAELAKNTEQIEISGADEPCPKCVASDEAAESLLEQQTEARQEAFNRFPVLSALQIRKNGQLTWGEISSGRNLYFISRRWLKQWRNSYITYGKENNLDEGIELAFTCAHDKFYVPKSVIDMLRGHMGGQVKHASKHSNAESAIFEIILQAEWEALLEVSALPPNINLYYVRVVKSPDAFMYKWGLSSRPNEELQKCVTCMPPIVQRRDIFQNEFIHTQLVMSDENIPTTQDSNTLAMPKRVSTRHRVKRTRTLQNVMQREHEILGSSDDSVYLLKYKLYELTNISPDQLQLHIGGIVVPEPASTLHSSGYRLGDTLYVRIVEDMNLAEENGNAQVGKSIADDEELLRAIAASMESSNTAESNKTEKVSAFENTSLLA